MNEHNATASTGDENQDVIWDHFQNEGVDAFSGVGPRVEFLASRLRSGERALNIGVGAGSLERAALGKGVDIWTLDPSERAIARLRETLAVGDKASVGYSQNIPFDSNAFDVVIMSEVLEHLDDAVLASTLPEVARVLRSGGRFIGTVPAREVLADQIAVCPSCGHSFHRWGHQRRFDIDSLRRMLAPQFEVSTADEQFFISWDRANWRQRLAGLIKKALSARNIGTYGLCRNIYFEAIKP